jgi:type IV secretory pathway component VirB8
LLLVGLIAMVAFSFVSAVYAFSVAWLMPIIFLALYMILRVLVPLRGAEPKVRDFRDQIAALERRLDALQISMSATALVICSGNRRGTGGRRRLPG